MKTEKHNIFLIGPMGAGKTSVARNIALRLNKALYDSDQEIEKRTGASLTWIYDLEGMAGFRERERKMIDELTQLKNIVLSTGGGCVEVPQIRTYLKERGVVVYMEVALETQLRRLKRDKKRPLLQGGNREDVLIRLWEEREPYYELIADYTVITDHRSIKDVSEDILDWLTQG